MLPSAPISGAPKMRSMERTRSEPTTTGLEGPKRTLKALGLVQNGLQKLCIAELGAGPDIYLLSCWIKFAEVISLRQKDGA